MPGRSVGGTGAQKSTGGVVRVIIVRDALEVVEHPYVVCIDAGTETELALSMLVGALEAGWDDRELGVIRRSRVPLLPAGFRAIVESSSGPWPRPS